VLEGIEAGFFDDSERMARLTVAFASRYLDALDAFRAGKRPTLSWLVAFEATARWRPLILQHLLAGINAHINLDLGIAAARTAPGDALTDLRRDFDRINEILASLIGHVQGGLTEVSPWVGLLDRFGARHDDVMMRFSLTVARTQAWRFATELAPLASADQAGPIRTRDAGVARLGRTVLHPGLPLSAGLLLIRTREQGDVRRNLEVLARLPAPSLDEVEARVADERAAPE
jgi:hypothetical protein